MPSAMRERNGFGKLQHESENEREGDHDNENGDDQSGNPHWHRTLTSTWNGSRIGSDRNTGVRPWANRLFPKRRDIE